MHLSKEVKRTIEETIIATILILHYIKKMKIILYSLRVIFEERKWNFTIWVLPLKNLELKNISQSELCHGICSQSQISKIEKGMIYPSSILLYQLSERLGIDPNNIFALTQNKKLKYIENVKCVMKDCIRQHQYKELYEIVTKEKT